MSKIENIHDLNVGQVFVTKKGKKMEVTDIKPDFANGLTEQEIYDNQDEFGKEKFQWGLGSVEVKKYVHRDSENITPKKGGKGYSWGHNTKWFKGYVRLDGRDGFLRTLEKEGWTLKKDKNEK